MKFIITTTQSFYNEEQKKTIDELGIPFKWRKDVDEYEDWEMLKDGDDSYPEIEISSLEELISLQKKVECPIILGTYIPHSKYRTDFENHSIEIYNFWRE